VEELTPVFQSDKFRSTDNPVIKKRQNKTEDKGNNLENKEMDQNGNQDNIDKTVPLQFILEPK
jgi:hypothetical protein